MQKLGLFIAVLMLGFGASAMSSYASYGSDGNLWRFGWSILRDDHTTNYSGQASQDSLTQHVSSKLGYEWSNGFYFGALYESSSMYQNASGTPTPESRVSYGPSIGYFNSGFFGLGSYFLSTNDNLPNGTSFSGGSGYEFELGYDYNVTSNFYIGISLIYNSFSWNQLNAGGSTISQNNAQTDTYPALGIGFQF